MSFYPAALSFPLWNSTNWLLCGTETYTPPTFGCPTTTTNNVHVRGSV